MATTKKTPAPPGLGPAGRGLWRRLVAEFEFWAAEAVLLEAMCGNFERYRTAAAALAAEGLTFEGRNGPAVRPEVAVARDCSNVMRLLARQLELEIPDGSAPLARPGPRPQTKIRALKEAQAAQRARREAAGGAA